MLMVHWIWQGELLLGLMPGFLQRQGLLRPREGRIQQWMWTAGWRRKGCHHRGGELPQRLLLALLVPEASHATERSALLWGLSHR